MKTLEVSTSFRVSPTVERRTAWLALRRAAASASVPALRGSFTANQRTSASRMPGTPATIKAIRQPTVSARTPPMTIPMSEPMGMPRPKKAMAEPRFSGGTVSPMREWEAGVQPASPMPTPMRARSSCQKFMARPQRTVMPDQMAREPETIPTRFDLGLSAHRAIGMPRTV